MNDPSNLLVFQFNITHEKKYDYLVFLPNYFEIPQHVDLLMFQVLFVIFFKAFALSFQNNGFPSWASGKASVC